MKKIISVLLLFAFVMVCAPAFADSENNYYVLSEFNGEGRSNTPSKGELSTDINLLEDASWKFSLSLAEDATNTKITFNEEDLSEYKYFNLLVYSEQVSEESYMIRFATTLKNASKNTCYLFKVFAVNWEGWKVLSIPTETFEKKYKATTDDNYWSKLDGSFGIYHKFGSDTYCSGEVPIYLDRAWMSNEAPKEAALVSTSPTNNDEMVGITNNTIKFNFSNNISKILDESKITVKKNEQILEASEYTVSAEEKSLLINLTNALDSETPYSCSLDSGVFADEFGFLLKEPCAISFTTVGAAPYVKSVGFDAEQMQNSLEIKGICELGNMSENDVNFVFVVGIYDKTTGAMKECHTQEATLGYGEEKTINLPFVGNENYEASAFVLIKKENGGLYPFYNKTAEIE